jgi:hypothetical protein
MKITKYIDVKKYDPKSAAKPAEHHPRKSKLKGGKKGFCKAVDEAFTIPAHSPAVRYSHARGFYATSGLQPKDDDVLWETLAFYCARDGSRSLRPKHYTGVVESIRDAEQEG